MSTSSSASALILALGVCSHAPAQVTTYEATVFPDQLNWQRRPVGSPHGERRLEDGWLIQTMRQGEQDFYRTELGQFAGVDRFFVEWRAVTDNPAWLLDLWQVPAVVSASGNATTYHTTLTDSVARLLRHLKLPIVFVNIDPEPPNTYRLEIEGTVSFTWYVNGQAVETGVPIRAYPDPTAFLIWGAETTHPDAPTSATGWDYIRFGMIPQDASGDYDSDGAITDSDHYFVHDCLTKDGPGIFGGPDQNAGPGCRFADFDGNDSVDLLDFAEFQNLFSEPRP